MTTSKSTVNPKVALTWEIEVAEKIKQNIAMSGGLADETVFETKPYMVALVGIPGSGKSTSGEILSGLLSNMGISCLHMPFDGYHFPLSVLKTFPNPEDALYRRGAQDTFDVETLKRDLRAIRDGGDDVPMVKVPGFDHAAGDPEPDAHIFERSNHRVVLCDGLYLLHGEDGWEDIKSLFDWSVYIDSDLEICIRRLKERNKCIPGYTPEEIDVRCDAVDRVNAITVMKSQDRADQVVKSAATRLPEEKV